MIPATAKPDCTACAKAGGTYDMHCRSCVGRWLRFLNSQAAGHDALQVWRDARHDWRIPLFEDFRERHEDDSWGAAINASERMATASLEEQRDFLTFLKRQVRSAVRRVPSA